MTTIDPTTDVKPETLRRRRFTARDRKRLLRLNRRSGQGAVRFCQSTMSARVIVAVAGARAAQQYQPSRFYRLHLVRPV